MKSDDLILAIGGIDDDLIEGANENPAVIRTNKPWVKWASVAATVVLLLAASATVPGIFRRNHSVIPQTDPLPETQIKAEDPPQSTPSGTQSIGIGGKPEEIDTSLLALQRSEVYPLIIWGDEEEDLSYLETEPRETVKWNGLNVTNEFYENLSASPDDAVFAVSIRQPYGHEMSFFTRNPYVFMHLGLPVYDGYHEGISDYPYQIMIATKAELASLVDRIAYAMEHYAEIGYDQRFGYQLFDYEMLEHFDFENACFSMVSFPEEDIAYELRIRAEAASYVPVPDDPDQVPETTRE